MMEVKAPENEKEWISYFDLRYRILRQPWNQPRGSEQDEGDKAGCHFSLWHNNELVAVARLDKTDDALTCQVRFVAVECKSQGKGYGKMLMRAVERVAMDQGFKYVRLQARENAIPFYLSLNYHVIEKSHLLFGTIQHYLMTKEL